VKLGRDPAGTETAHLVLADRVGFFALPSERRRALDLELSEAIRTCPAIRQLPDSKRIVSDLGGCFALVFFGEPTRAAEAATYLHRTIQGTSDSPLRIGCHAGPVARRRDMSGKWNVSGRGVEEGRCVMACSDGATIVASSDFANSLGALDSWGNRFGGEFEREVIQGERLRLYSMSSPAEDTLANPLAKKVVILYKRGSELDEAVRASLEISLRSSEVDVFLDRKLVVGADWANEIESQIRSADYVIVLVSDASLQSEMILAEVEIALSSLEKTGLPKLLPVALQLDGELDGEIGRLLSRYQFAIWGGTADNDRLSRDLVRAMGANEDRAGTRFHGVLEPAGGAVPLVSPFYIARPADEEFSRALAARESIVLVKGARQIGKT
jgi:hypothetical protein